MLGTTRLTQRHIPETLNLHELLISQKRLRSM